MFRPVPATRLWFALALACCMTTGAAQTPSSTVTPASAPTTAAATGPATAPEPIVANPHYLAWAKYKPGTQVELDMSTLAGGQDMTTRVTMTLAEVTADRAVVRTVATVTLPGVFEGQEHAQTHTFDARVPQSVADRALRPAGGEGAVTEAGTEQVTAAGRTYEARVHAFDGKVQTVPATARLWRSDDVPGGLVRMESTSGTSKVELVLKRVTLK